MTQDEIIEMAMSSGLPSKEAARQKLWWIKSFAKLVAAKEREACALACFDYSCKKEGWPAYQKAADECEKAIRARGEA